MSDFIPNSYQTPNSYVDRFMHLLTPDEWVVLSYTARRIFGFNKRMDNISLSQFEDGTRGKDGAIFDHGTGLSRARIVAELHKLIEFRLLDKVSPNDPKRKLGACYRLQMDSKQVDEGALQKRFDERYRRDLKRSEPAREKQKEDRLRLDGLTSPEGEVRLDDLTSVRQECGQTVKPELVRRSNRTHERSAVRPSNPQYTVRNTEENQSTNSYSEETRKEERKPAVAEHARAREAGQTPPPRPPTPPLSEIKNSQAQNSLSPNAKSDPQSDVNRALEPAPTEPDAAELAKLCCVNLRRSSARDREHWPGALGTIRDAMPDATPAERAAAIGEFGRRWALEEGRGSPYLSQIAGHWLRMMSQPSREERAQISRQAKSDESNGGDPFERTRQERIQRARAAQARAYGRSKP